LNQIKKSKLEIEANNSKIEELEAKIKSLQQQIDRYERIHFRLLNIQKQNYYGLKSNKNQLSNKVASTNQINYKRIQHLVVLTNKVLDKLNYKFKKVEKLLNLMKKCKAFEVAHDQVISIDNYDIFEYFHCDFSINTSFFSDKSSAEFFKKYNLANLHVSVLSKDKSDLIKENLSLKKHLKEYISSLKNDEKLILSKFT
jgi:hypothetical protein